MEPLELERRQIRCGEPILSPEPLDVSANVHADGFTELHRTRSDQRVGGEIGKLPHNFPRRRAPPIVTDPMSVLFNVVRSVDDDLGLRSFAKLAAVGRRCLMPVQRTTSTSLELASATVFAAKVSAMAV